MFSFYEFAADPDHFFEKCDEIKVLSEIENYLFSLNSENIDILASTITDLIQSKNQYIYVIAKSILKCCFSRPFSIELYLAFIQKIKEKTRNLLFGVFKRLVIIEYKIDSPLNGHNNDIDNNNKEDNENTNIFFTEYLNNNLDNDRNHQNNDFLNDFDDLRNDNKVRPEIMFILNRLLEMKEISPVDLIHTQIEKHLQFIHYFDNEQMKIAMKKSSNEFKKSIIDFKKESDNDANWSLHVDLLNKGLNHDPICKCIEIDDIDSLIQFASNPILDIYSITVNYSIYDRVKLPFDDVSFIEFSAFCGSLECFKFLILNINKVNPKAQKNIKKRLAVFAVSGGNAEIIHICEHNEINFANETKYALLYHRPEIFKWLVNIKNEKFPIILDFLKYCIIGGCFNLIIEYLPKLTHLKEFIKMTIIDGNNLLFDFLHQFKESEINAKENYSLLKICSKNGNVNLFRYFNRRTKSLCFNCSSTLSNFSPTSTINKKNTQSKKNTLIKNDKKKNKNLFLLHLASFSESGDIVQILLDRKEINIDQENENGETPFHISCQNSSSEVARILMNHSCDVNKQNIDGKTGLHFACENGNIKIVKILLDQPDLMIDIKDNVEFETALHVAARRGFSDIVSLLLQKGFYVNESASCYMTPLHFGCLNGNFDVVQCLLKEKENEININGETKNQNSSSFDQTLTSSKPNCFNLIDPKYGEYMTPLHFAVVYGKSSIVELLIKFNSVQRIEINKFAAQGETKSMVTPLHIACKNGLFDIAKLLLSNTRIEINAKTIGIEENNLTPLHYACKNGYYNIVKLLLSCKGDIRINEKAFIKKEIYNSFHLAAMYGHLDIVGILLKKVPSFLNSQTVFFFFLFDFYF